MKKTPLDQALADLKAANAEVRGLMDEIKPLRDQLTNLKEINRIQAWQLDLIRGVVAMHWQCKP